MVDQLSLVFGRQLMIKTVLSDEIVVMSVSLVHVILHVEVNVVRHVLVTLWCR